MVPSDPILLVQTLQLSVSLVPVMIPCSFLFPAGKLRWRARPFLLLNMPGDSFAACAGPLPVCSYARTMGLDDFMKRKMREDPFRPPSVHAISLPALTALEARLNTERKSPGTTAGTPASRHSLCNSRRGMAAFLPEHSAVASSCSGDHQCRARYRALPWQSSLRARAGRRTGEG